MNMTHSFRFKMRGKCYHKDGDEYGTEIQCFNVGLYQ